VPDKKHCRDDDAPVTRREIRAVVEMISDLTASVSGITNMVQAHMLQCDASEYDDDADDDDADDDEPTAVPVAADPA
jgi:hypothetical protein